MPLMMCHHPSSKLASDRKIIHEHKGSSDLEDAVRCTVAIHLGGGIGSY